MEIISAWELYWWTRLDSIGTFFRIGGVILLVANLLWIPGWSCADDIYEEESFARVFNKFWKYTLFIPLFMLLFSSFIPTKKEMAMIYVIPKLANSQTIQTEAKEIYDIAKSALKEYAGIEEKK